MRTYLSFSGMGNLRLKKSAKEKSMFVLDDGF